MDGIVGQVQALDVLEAADDGGNELELIVGQVEVLKILERVAKRVWDIFKLIVGQVEDFQVVAAHHQRVQVVQLVVAQVELN